MKKLLFIFPLLLFFILISCDSPNKCQDSKTLIYTYNGEFYVGISKSKRQYDGFLQIGYSCFGYGIYPTLKDIIAVDGGILTISNTKLQFNPFRAYPRQVTYGDWALDTSYMDIPEFGGFTKWSLEGNSENNIPPFEIYWYVPKDITIKSPLAKEGYILKENGFNIEWEADSLNKDKVSISLEWRITSDSIYNFGKLVDDVGKCFINLDTLPEGNVILKIIRYNDTIINANGMKYRLSSYSSDEDYFKIIE